MAPANYLDWRASSASFSGLAAYRTRAASLTIGGVATRGTVAVVSGNFFQVLGAEPTLGAGFDPIYDPAFERRVACLSHALWVTRFGGAPGVVGGTLRVDDVWSRDRRRAPGGNRLSRRRNRGMAALADRGAGSSGASRGT